MKILNYHILVIIIKNVYLLYPIKSTTTSLLKVYLYSTASFLKLELKSTMTASTASGSSALTWNIGDSIVLATSLQYNLHKYIYLLP